MNLVAYSVPDLDVRMKAEDLFSLAQSHNVSYIDKEIRDLLAHRVEGPYKGRKLIYLSEHEGNPTLDATMMKIGLRSARTSLWDIFQVLQVIPEDDTDEEISMYFFLQVERRYVAIRLYWGGDGWELHLENDLQHHIEFDDKVYFRY